MISKEKNNMSGSNLSLGIVGFFILFIETKHMPDQSKIERERVVSNLHILNN